MLFTVAILGFVLTLGRRKYPGRLTDRSFPITPSPPSPCTHTLHMYATSSAVSGLLQIEERAFLSFLPRGQACSVQAHWCVVGSLYLSDI